MNVPLCSDTAPMASVEGTWTTFMTAALQAGLSQHREWRAPSSRDHWAGSRRSRKEKEKEKEVARGQVLRKVSWLWFWNPLHEREVFPGKVHPLPLHRHTSKEMGTTQKLELLERKAGLQSYM